MHNCKKKKKRIIKNFDLLPLKGLRPTSMYPILINLSSLDCVLVLKHRKKKGEGENFKGENEIILFEFF